VEGELVGGVGGGVNPCSPFVTVPRLVLLIVMGMKL
jgi:hypothetical protein